MAIVQLDDVEKILRLDSPQPLTHAQCIHEQTIRFFTFPAERVRERERAGNELTRADETEAREKVARTYQPDIVGLIWRCAGVGQH